MKQVLLNAFLVIIASAMHTNAQIRDRGYISPAFAFVIPPFFPSIATQTYPDYYEHSRRPNEDYFDEFASIDRKRPKVQNPTDQDLYNQGLYRNYDLVPKVTKIEDKNTYPKTNNGNTHHELYNSNTNTEIDNRNGNQVIDNGNAEFKIGDRNTQPEIGNKNPQPEIGSRNAQPEIDYRNENPAVGYTNVQPEVGNRNAQPKIGNINVQPEIGNKNVQPDLKNGNIVPSAKNSERVLSIARRQNGNFNRVPINAQSNAGVRHIDNKTDNQNAIKDDSVTFVGDIDDRSTANTVLIPQETPSKALTGFGLQMVKLLNSMGSTNPAFSPYSIASVLALLQQGAGGNSQREIQNVLSMSPQVSSDAFRYLLTSIKERNTRNILKIATNIFVNNAFVLSSRFKNTAVRNFDSAVTPTNFNQPAVSARVINQWVADKTQNRIPELVSADMLSENTQMVLANAIFFKGIWQNKFDPKNTTRGDFHLANGDIKKVQFMNSRLALPVGLDFDLEARYAVMPFEGEQYKLMMLVPEEDINLNTVLEKLTAEKLLEYLSVTKKDITVQIPKFTIQHDVDLTNVLRRMGIREIFGPQSNLQEVGTFRNFSPQISSAIHKAVLSIDEQGGTAAAATLFPAVALSYDDSNLYFKLDKPFLTILWDAENAVPLFVAKIDDPSM